MKITIDIELDASEVALAADLMATLRSITDHVKAPPPVINVNQVAELAAHPISSLPSQASSPSKPVSMATTLSANAPRRPSVVNQPIEPPPAVAPVVVQANGRAAVPASAAHAAGATEPAVNAPLQASFALQVSFEACLQNLDDENLADQMPAEIYQLLHSPPDGATSEEAVLALIAAFGTTVLTEENVRKDKSVFPYFQMLPSMPEPLKTMVRDKLIPKVLKQLTQKRNIDTERVEFFAHAEAFAALVGIDFVSVGGAIQTITTLLRKPETRSAAVTMLGKTVEMCLPQLQTKCPAEVLQNLRNELRNINDEQFVYDLEYVNEMMGWTRQGVLTPIASFTNGHSNVIFGLCWHQPSNQLLSGGRDGKIVLWSANGEVMDTTSVAGYYPVAMDIHPKHDLLLSAFLDVRTGQKPQPPNMGPPIITAYSVGRGLSNKGTIYRPSSSSTGQPCIQCIKGMPLSDLFVTGDSLLPGSPEDNVINIFDLASSGFSNLEPIGVLRGHRDTITCFAASSVDPHLLLSGSKEGSVLMWDVRASTSHVGTLGGNANAHGGWVMGIDMQQYIVATGSADSTCKIWDYRQNTVLHSFSFNEEDKHVLKVALGEGGQYGAASTLKRLYHMDWTSGTLAVAAQPSADGSPQGAYYGLQWAHSPERPFAQLYAAGKHMRVDVFDAR